MARKKSEEEEIIESTEEEEGLDLDDYDDDGSVEGVHRELMEAAMYDDEIVIDPELVQFQGDMSTKRLKEALEVNDSKIDKQIKELQRAHADKSRTYDEARMVIRRQVRWLYDTQRLRIATAGAVAKNKATKTQLREVDQEILQLRAKQLYRWELKVETDLRALLETVPAYTKILSQRPKYWGIGVRMAGVILSEFDIRRQDTCSKMWAFAGLAPEPALKCKECGVTIPALVSPAWKKKLVGDHRELIKAKKADMVNALVAQGLERAKALKETNTFYMNYTSPIYKPPPYDLLLPKKHPRNKCRLAGKAMQFSDCVEGKKGAKRVAGFLGHYNSWLRTKLVGVLAPIMVKGADKCPARLKYYDPYKARLTQQDWGQSKGHRNNAAMRYMIKMVLADIHREWRQLEGLPVRPMYQEEYLGHTSSRKAL